ncbi:unnamed protein product [Cyclocybe aegerita]|uniref:Uncharacterized protein n=1 Tax=Cyclocybe aegerita TaxID=1973307 RepID=A0A8S0VZQ3_CYCAE|nr:unnamed protein product [Cyclocybe aegerita]
MVLSRGGVATSGLSTITTTTAYTLALDDDTTRQLSGSYSGSSLDPTPSSPAHHLKFFFPGGASADEPVPRPTHRFEVGALTRVLGCAMGCGGRLHTRGGSVDERLSLSRIVRRGGL